MAARSGAAAEAPRRVTVEEFEALHRAGVWREDDRVELINGEIRQMNPVNDPHVGCVNRLTWLFSRRLGDEVIVHVQNPVRLDPFDEPQPDVAVLRFRSDFYGSSKATARDILLLVEVADSSLREDLRDKRDVYARSGIQEYWVIDLNQQLVHVHTSPDAATGRYRQVITVGRGRELAPLFAPGVVIRVDEVLGV